MIVFASLALIVRCGFGAGVFPALRTSLTIARSSTLTDVCPYWPDTTIERSANLAIDSMRRTS